MQRPFLLFICFFLFLQSGIAQQINHLSESKWPTKQRWMVQFAPVQLVFLEYHLIGEYSYKKNGFGIHLSTRPAYKSELSVIEYEWFERLYESYRALNYLNPLQNNYTVGSYYKVYLGHHYIMHLKFHGYYRHWWFKDKQTEYEDLVRRGQGYQFSGIRTENQDVYGIKTYFGGTFQVDVKPSLDLIIEPYIGWGYRFRTYHYETWDGEFWGEPIDYNREEGSDHFISVHWGLHIGFGKMTTSKKNQNSQF